MYNNVLMNILGRRDNSRNNIAQGPMEHFPTVINDLPKALPVPGAPKYTTMPNEMPKITPNPATPGFSSYKGGDIPKVGILPPQYKIGIPERINPAPLPVVKVPYMGLAKGGQFLGQPIRAFSKTDVVNNIVGTTPTTAYSLPQPIRMPFAAKRRLI